jgi:hypothetical protein
LVQNEVRLRCREKRLQYNTMCEYLVYLKNEHTFLREAYSQCLFNKL